jgi:primosomal protein N' (replication factor Y)
MTHTSTLILRLALPTPLRRLFDYLAPEDIDTTVLIKGVRVHVPFQSRTLVGILVEVSTTSSVPLHKLKRALAVFDETPFLSPDIYQLCEWSAQYYHYALGEVLAAALPLALRKAQSVSVPAPLTVTKVKADEMPVLNADQQCAVSTICAAQNTFQVFLLDGVTGSGKTEVYLRCIAETLRIDKQVLVLVPEISLTPQTIKRFRARFNLPIVTLHSNLSEKSRLHAWLAARSGEARIVIGTRSAIFTPFAQLGLVIVDEEHDPSFKQQDRFRYHARDLAIVRARANQTPVILGSATPSLESLLNAKRERYTYLSLPARAGKANLPTFEILNIQKAVMEEGVSHSLLQKMHAHLDQGNQVMLFLNRRGFAPVLYCTQCAWMAMCTRCDTRMVYHRSPPRLRCHHCNAQSRIPTRCAQCGDQQLQPVGIGTQRLETMLNAHFPKVPLIRVDRDSTRRKGAMQKLLQEIDKQPCAILLGTQMLAKGHHFPHVTLVGIVDADSGLFSADFRAAEQIGQLLVQVAGRAGREQKPGTVVIQTRHPQHPLLHTLIHEGYSAFTHILLNEREQAVLPPYSYFAVFRAEAYVEEGAHRFLTAIKEMCAATQAITILGPVPALLAKRKGLHCQHLLIKADKRTILQEFLASTMQKIETLSVGHAVKWILDVDPVEV